MRAIFLAGGASRRMKPLTYDKNLIPFLGKPAIVYNLEVAKQGGIADFVVVVNEGNYQTFVNVLKDAKIKAEVVVQADGLKGQGGAVLAAKKYLNGPVLICNANDFFEASLYKEVLKKTKQKTDGILVGYKVKNYFPGGYLKLKDDQVLEIIEKPDPDKVPSEYVRIVMDYFKEGKNLANALEKTVKSDPDRWYEDAITKLIKEQKKFTCVKYDGIWEKLKYPWHILDVTNYFLNSSFLQDKVSRNAKISPQAIIDHSTGSVQIEDGVRIFSNAVVRGPVYVGKGTLIGNGALVRESLIGENSIIGYNTEIARSYIGNKCWFHTNYIGDSILDEDISFGSGAITANLRLDEGEITSVVKGKKVPTDRVKFGAVVGSGVRIGVNAMIMPGVKVGKGSFVGSGVVLDKDLEDNKFCYVKQSQVIVENKSEKVAQSREKFLKNLK